MEAQKNLRPNKELVEANKDLVNQYWNFPKDTKETEKHYDDLADKYDFILEDICGYNDPHYVTECVKRYIKPEQKICDFGSGTGILGKYLVKAGYKNLWGVDGSEKMIEKCKPLGLYHDIRKVLVTVDPLPEEYKNKFDAVVSTGCFLKGHFPNGALDVILDSLNVGGIMFFSIRNFYLEPENEQQYKPKIDALVAEGKAEVVEQYKYTKYEGIKKEDGFGDNFTEMPSSIMMIRKLK